MAGEPPLWGWCLPQRVLLAALVAAGAVGLLVAGRIGDPGTAPPPSAVAIDVNAAPPAVLLALPGLGPTLVDRIVAARDDRPFDSLDDLARRVKGVGEATIAGLRPHVRVGPGDGAVPVEGPPR